MMFEPAVLWGKKRRSAHAAQILYLIPGWFFGAFLNL
jgi:hypothetical protein